MRVMTKGKLYLAGEYAVTFPGQTAVILPVPEGIGANLSFGEGYILSDIYDSVCHWHYQLETGKVESDDRSEYRYLLTIIELVSSYLQEKNYHLRPFGLKLRSNLHYQRKIKYGLGSSAASAVALVQGILELYHVIWTPEKLFKLTSAILLLMGSNGSMGDIACVSYGQLISYTTFDIEWVKKCLKKEKLSYVVDAIWPNLAIRPLANRLNMPLLVGWTGQAADSAMMVKKVTEGFEPVSRRLFLEASQRAVNQIIEGIEKGDEVLFCQGINENHQVLAELGRLINQPIETKRLSKLVMIARKYQAVGKLSGAGGGDCGLAFLVDSRQKEMIEQAWRQAGIDPFMWLPDW